MRWSAIFVGALLFAQPLVASAIPPFEETQLTEDRGWPSGSIQRQLDRDATLVPFGKGAVFVPAMTNPLDEPPVEIWQGEKRVTEGTTGTRIVLAPGTYQIRLGSGADVQRLRVQATVRENHTTVIPVSWSGLTVHVVDETFGSSRTSYEIIRVEDREYMGVGFGTDEQAGEPVSTWIMAPGLYKIVRLGDTYRARRDFATVRLVGGKHTHFLLVLQADTGEFAGAGEVPAEELFRPTAGFFGSLVLGGDVSFNSRSNVPGVQDGLSFSFRGFTDARMSVQLFGNPLILQFQVEQGQTKNPNLPWTKSNDRIDLDALYIYRLKRWLGPYIRLGVETNLLPGFVNFEPEQNVAKFDAQNNLLFWQRNQQRLRVSDSLGLTTIKEGAGMNVRLFKYLFAESTLRTGLGARHRLTRNLFEEVERGALDGYDFGASSAPPIGDEPFRLYRSIDSDSIFGVEFTLLAIGRITRWVLLNLELDTLVPFGNFDTTILNIDASVALKLTSFMSINYVFRYLRDPAILESDRIEQDILLRFSLEVW